MNMPIYLVDLTVSVGLLAAFLWMADRKRQPRGLAITGAFSWLIGAFIALAVVRVWQIPPSEAGGIQVVLRVVPTIVFFFYMWSRPDWLPSRTIGGKRSQCVYREPGPIEAKRIADYLVGEGLQATSEAQSVWVAESDVPKARKLLPSYVSWSLVFRGREASAARFVEGWLRRNGLEAQIRGEQKLGVMGGVPVDESFPDVWVRGADRERAEALIAQMDAPQEGVDWTCPACNEDNGPAFATCWSCGEPGPQKKIEEGVDPA